MKIKDVILEKAPPEAKYKRMAKHIKAGYKGSGLDKDEIAQRAFGATWKAHNKEKGVAEQQGSNYTKDELVAILSGQKTQAQVDAERKSKPTQTSTQTPQQQGSGKSQTPAREATGDKMGQVTSVTPAGDVKIKTPTGTEITTKKDALLPGAQPGTVQMKPDAADDALKPGTQVVSSEDMNDDAELDRIKELAGTAQSDAGVDLSMDYMRKEIQDAGDLSPEEKAEVEKNIVVKPNGQVDVMATFSKMRGTMLYSMDEILELFINMGKEIQQAMSSSDFKTAYTPEQQKGAAEFVAMIPQLEKQRQELTQSASKDDAELNKLSAQQGDFPSMEEDQAADNVTSPISGAEDHDEITKLMVQRIRKLAGL
jgi:hypothetical protein